MRLIHKTSFPEVLVEHLWVQVSMGQLDPGDVFRIRKPDGTIFENDKGETVWRVTEIPHIPYEATD